ncbi:M20/M25/M40 family metallo-hydrolase [Halalkalibaculum roseum]|nr:M20/M25/M40 family metallo-hydrolase [Halalkalibaculum roseum]
METKTFEDIIESIPDLEKAVKDQKEMLLANLVMMGEIPAPTFGEEERINFLIDRFKEADLQENSIDEVGNGIGILKGDIGDENILVVAHADTVFDDKTDHTIKVLKNMVQGPGVADNSLGLSTVATLPTLLERLGIKLKNNLILMGATRSLGRGNLEGLRSFLSNYDEPIKAGIGLEGVELGRVSHTSIGMKRGEIQCRVPEEYNWSRFGNGSAILTLNEVINKINNIHMPQRPRTSIIMGSISGGSSFNTTALKATLQFEIRSESSEQVQSIHQNFEEIVSEVASKSGDSIELDIFAQREPGGIPYTHPLVRNTRKILNKLDLEPRPGPSTSELSTFIDRDIPAVTLGLTEGDHIHEVNESIKIEPMYKGIAQTIATLKAIDGGYCEEA